MSTSGDHSLRNGIIATVVGGLILTALVLLIQRFAAALLTVLGTTIRNSLQLFALTTLIPNYLITLYVALLIAVSVAFARYAVKIRTVKAALAQHPTSPEDENAKQDEINGLQDEVNALQAEVYGLQDELSKLKAQTVPQLADLAGLDDKIKLEGTTYNFSSRGHDYVSVTLSWREIFALIAPSLLEHPNETLVKNSIVSRAIFHNFRSQPTIDPQDYETIKIHLMALKLVSVDYIQTTAGGMALFWSLTPSGQSLLLELRSVRKDGSP